MTDAEQTQYDRFRTTGYEPDLAAALIERGAWLGIRDPLAEDIAEINRYRAERDRRRSGRQQSRVKKGADHGPEEK